MRLLSPLLSAPESSTSMIASVAKRPSDEWEPTLPSASPIGLDLPSRQAGCSMAALACLAEPGAASLRAPAGTEGEGTWSWI